MPRVSKLTTQIAARSLARQAGTLTFADTVAAEADSLIDAIWKQVAAAVQSVRGPHDQLSLLHHVNALIAGIEPALTALLSNRFSHVAVWSYSHTAAAVVDHVPVHRLKAVAFESRLTEETGVFITPTGPRVTLNPLDRSDVTDAAKRDLLRNLIFPPPTRQDAFGVIYAGDWRQRLANQTKIAAPHRVASVLLRAETQGDSIRDRAKDLLPVLNGVKSSARRIAHDETARVAHTMQWKAWQEIGDLIDGYQVFAVDHGHSPRSRPAHRERHGTIYRKNPKPGEKGLDELPRPPYEADGTLAFGCRCWISPVFHSEEIDPSNAYLSGALDPDSASDWFDQASERDRRAAVGAANYNLVQQQTDRKPLWSDFIDASGSMLPADTLTQQYAWPFAKASQVQSVFARLRLLGIESMATADLKSVVQFSVNAAERAAAESELRRRGETEMI